MFELVEVSLLEKSIQSLWMIAIILLTRRYFNLKSIKYANEILWVILFVYLLIPYSILIDAKDFTEHSVFEEILKLIILLNDYSKMITMQFGEILSRINRVLVSSLIFIYTIYQIYKMHTGLIGSTLVKEDKRIANYIALFRFKRKITILVNDRIKVPITYGIIKPKIIIQSHIFKDDELLKYVLIHELIHIKKYDMVFTHIKNLIACLYWYNPFVLVASRYSDDDIEILCDKLVVQKIGDTAKTRKEYSMSMLNLIEENERGARFTLKLNPTYERIIIMRKWKISLVGVMSFVIAALISTVVFADVDKSVENIIVSDELSNIEDTIENNNLSEFTNGEQIRIISDEEYNSLELGESLFQSEPRPFLANFDKSETLGGLSNKKYSFDMKSWTEANHNSFAVKISDMSCSSGVDYQIIIQKNGNDIYNEKFNNGKNIIIENTQNNSKYNVIINNLSTNSLKYNIKINSYIK